MHEQVQVTRGRAEHLLLMRSRTYAMHAQYYMCVYVCVCKGA